MTRENGTMEYVTMERADEPVEVGTPINKALFDNVQNDIYNKIFRASQSSATNVSLSTQTGTQTIEIQTDGSRFILLTFIGGFGNRNTNSVMLYDCLENKFIFFMNFLANFTGFQINSKTYSANKVAENLGYMYSSQEYVYNSLLSVSFDNNSKKIICKMTATTTKRYNHRRCCD